MYSSLRFFDAFLIPPRGRSVPGAGNPSGLAPWEDQEGNTPEWRPGGTLTPPPHIMVLGRVYTSYGSVPESSPLVTQELWQRMCILQGDRPYLAFDHFSTYLPIGSGVVPTQPIGDNDVRRLECIRSWPELRVIYLWVATP